MKEIRKAGWLQVIGHHGIHDEAVKLPAVSVPEVDDFEWGSSQYLTAARLYHALANEFGQNGDVEKTLAKFKICVLYASHPRRQEISLRIKKAMNAPIKRSIANNQAEIAAYEAMLRRARKKPLWIRDARDPEATIRKLIRKDKRELAEASGWKKNPKALTDVMHFLRGHSWDLWTAAPFAAKIGLIIRLEAPESIMLGSVNRAEHAGLNVKAAILCWLLHRYFRVPEEAFKNFDT